MDLRVRAALFFLPCLILDNGLFAQTKPGSDVIVFPDGEKLIGELQSATDTRVVFKSDIGFVVTVPWAKIQELRTSKKVAAIHKGVILRDPEQANQVPQGTLEMTNQKLTLQPDPQAPSVTIPVNEVSNVVDEKAFVRALHHQSLMEGWKGNIAAGIALTESTISNRTITGSIDLSRSDPGESWQQVHNRTTVDLNLMNGLITQPYTANTKIFLIHSDLVHDFYFKPRWFAFAGASFDHNYSQGLDLLQAYGGGIGAVVVKTELSEFDVRAGLGFMRQNYTDPTLNRNLLGSRFAQNFSHTFKHGVNFYEQGGIRPAWNDMKNFFGGFLVSLGVPVYHQFGLSLSSFDSYINNPPPYFKKNTFQISLGLTYTVK